MLFQGLKFSFWHFLSNFKGESLRFALISSCRVYLSALNSLFTLKIENRLLFFLAYVWCLSRAEVIALHSKQNDLLHLKADVNFSFFRLLLAYVWFKFYSCIVG